MLSCSRTSAGLPLTACLTFLAMVVFSASPSLAFVTSGKVAVPKTRDTTASTCTKTAMSLRKDGEGDGVSWSLDRRSFSTAALSAAALSFSKPAGAKEKAGAWAKHDGPFSAEELSGFTTAPSGLQFKDIEVGTGPVPVPGQKIKAHYAGYLQANGKKFDASYDRGSPLAFKVGTGQVIKGWDEGLLSMAVGGKRVLVIPSELAYGKRAVGGGLIPADSVLVFYVELVTLAA